MTIPYALLLWIVGVLVSLLPQTAQAACTPAPNWNNQILTFTFPMQIIVQANAPVGTVFYDARTNFFARSGEVYTTCDANSSNHSVTYQNGWATDGNGIAATNVAGVGLRLYWLRGSGAEVLVPRDPYLTTTGPVRFVWAANQPTWRIQLIKTGNITGGTLRAGAWAVYSAGGTQVTTLNIGGGGAITPVGCTVTTPTVNVALGQRLKSEFTGVGSATPWQSFDIGLNCNQSARINVRIDATQDPSNVAGVMQLDRASVPASGVGVQLWYRSNGGTPVNFGQETFYAASTNGGVETIQLQARYYQTAQTIIAGTANATATFTLNYK